MVFSKSGFCKSFVFLGSALSCFSIFAKEDITEGGAILKDLVTSCQIVGIGTSNGGARYALRKIREKDIFSADYDKLVIKNLEDGEKSFGRPKFITLTLNQVERNAAGEIETYYIRGAFSTSPLESARLTIGTLSEIAFSVKDSMRIDVNNSYGFRGLLSSATIELNNPSSVANPGFTGRWDLALPGTFSKDGICATRETTPRDSIFIR